MLSNKSWVVFVGRIPDTGLVMSVPGRIRALRRQRGLTVDALADAVGIHKGHLSRIERGEKSPSLATLEAIAHALGTGMAELFGEKTEKQDIVITRKGNRTKAGSKDYWIESLLVESDARPLSAYIVSPGSEFLEHDVPQHAGQEFLFVLKGRIDVSVADQRFTLVAGDSAAYDAGLRHKIRRAGRSATDVLVVIGKI